MPPGYAGASGVGEQPIPGMMALPGIAGAGGSASAAAASSRQASQAEPQVDWEAARNEQLWQQVEAAVAAAEEQERDGRVAEAVEGAQAALQALEAQHGSAPLPLVVLRQLLWDLLFALVRGRGLGWWAPCAGGSTEGQFGLLVLVGRQWGVPCPIRGPRSTRVEGRH